MPRRHRVSDLPPLPETCPLEKSPLPVNQTAELEAQLRRVALRYRGSKRLRFYTMGEIAAHFQFSKASAFHVYRRLQDEGLLKVQRGAQTWLLPQQAKRKANLRGILALAAWFPGLAQFPDWRVFLRQFELSARKHQIACYPLLYEHLEDTGEDFFNRIRQYQPDWFAWLYPPPSQRETLLKLHDAGISPLLFAQSKRGLAEFSPYFVDLRKPVVSLLQKWKSHGIKMVTVYADSGDFPLETGDWKPWVEEAGVEFCFADLHGGIFPEAPSGRSTEGIILPETFGTSLLLQRWKHHPSYWENQHILLTTRPNLEQVVTFGESKHLYGILPDWGRAAEIILDTITDPAKKRSGLPTPLPAKMLQAKSLADFDPKPLLVSL